MLSNRLSIALQRRNAAADSSHEDGQALRDGLRVSLSALGKVHSAAEQKNRDIDESSLPDTIKQVLRMIRALKAQIVQMLSEAVDVECLFSEDVLSGGVAGLSPKDMRQYLEYCADQRLAQLGLPRHFGARNPFPFMELQDVQELTNFFERRVSAYQVGIQGEVAFDAAF